MPEKFAVIDGFPDYSDYVCVNWDDCKAAQEKDLIGTYNATVCLVTTLYDPSKKRGVLSHIKGVKGIIEHEGINPEDLLPENVIDAMLRLMDVNKADYKGLEASLAGETKGQISPIVRKRINNYGIRLIGEDLGKAHPRWVFLHCDSGMVEVYRCG